MPPRKMSGVGRPLVRSNTAVAQALNTYKPIRSVVGEGEFHRCRRCQRTLPSSQFGLVTPKFTPRSTTWRVQFLHPFCIKCRGQLKGRHINHPLYSAKIDRRITDLTQHFRAMSYGRQILFLLDKDDVLEIYLRQDGKCRLTGVSFSMERAPDPGEKNELAPSLDRIDSSGNYTLDNVQLVLACVNIAKNAMSQASFIRMCRLVAETSYRDELRDLVDPVSTVASSPRSED